MSCPETRTVSSCLVLKHAPFRVFEQVVDGELYAAGGFDGTKDLDTVEKYNPASNTYTPPRNTKPV
jgi:hypothetical protein